MLIIADTSALIAISTCDGLHWYRFGSVGILLMAKHQGLIPAIKPYLERIQDSEVYMGKALFAEALKMAGES